MNILITGGTGFVGSHMIDFLLKKTAATIYSSRRWRSRDENIKHLYGNPRVVFIEADLNDRSSLSALIEKSLPNYVFHFAAQSFPETSFIYPTATLQTNIIGTVNLMEELLSARNRLHIDPRIISVSSSEVYGMPLPEEVPIKETNPIRAANPYSISKVGHDLMSQYYFQAHKLDIVITRMFSHEGARRGERFALSSFARQIALHEKTRSAVMGLEAENADGLYRIYIGNLNSVRTYSHIDDAVRAYWTVALLGAPGEVYNIGGTETCTVGDALERLLAMSTIPRQYFDTVIAHDRIRPTDITLQIPDCTKFTALTEHKWKQEKTLNDICFDLLSYWRERV